MTEYIARVATLDDMPALLELARIFVKESRLPYEFDREAANRAFWRYLRDGATEVVVAEVGDDLAGAAILAVDMDFTARPLGYLVKYYVLPDHRRTMASRRLLETCMAWFEKHACTDVWATATAGVGEDHQFVALLGKVGFEPVGPTLRKANHG